MSTENTIKEKFILTITANTVISTDSRFDINNLGLGDYYKTLDVKFENSNGEIITRNYNKGERKNSNQTLPRLAFQIFEKEIVNLSAEEKEMFPVCKYNPDSELKHGIYSSVASFKRYRNSIEYMKYSYGEGRLFVIYCWNLFSTIIFVQECLKRFGQEGDKFILTYRDKDSIESEENTIEATVQEELEKPIKEYRNPYSRKLIESKNIIFRGAPGTGKTYLAKQIAADIISDGYYDNYELLSDEQKQQIEFVDGSVKAQLGASDMRLPIQFALSYPHRWPAIAKPVKWQETTPLTGDYADEKTFGCLALARHAGTVGGTLPCIMNAANEVANHAFRRGRCSFLDIERIVAETMNASEVQRVEDLQQLTLVDAEARALARSFVG